MELGMRKRKAESRVEGSKLGVRSKMSRSDGHKNVVTRSFA